MAQAVYSKTGKSVNGFKIHHRLIDETATAKGNSLGYLVVLTNEKFNKNSTLDMVYVNNRGVKRVLTNINPDEFTEYFETKRLSDFTRHNVGTLPPDKADKFKEQEINISNIQELILDGQKIWTRYKSDME